MMFRRTQVGAACLPELGVCRRALLCAGIAAVLGGWVTMASGTPLAAAAAPADGADASGGGYADFDRSLLSGAGSNTTDLSRFEHGNPVLPGIYNADVYLNGTWVGRSDVRFAGETPKASATPCVDGTLLTQLGLHPEKLSAELTASLKDLSACVSIGSLIPDASMSFDMGELRLDTSVPQASLGQAARGYVSPEYWDAGIPAALLNYSFNSYHTSSQGQQQTSAYLSMNAGFNLGRWHFRQDSTIDWQSATAAMPARRQWQNIDAYAQRDLPSLRAQLTVGDSYTDGAVFDSYGLRGVQLASDDRMLPDSLRGYAPVVRGVAGTNAKVTVRQNGVQIYQTTVAPGPFTINDLYPTGYGGNLDVTVTEADGRTQSFSVPYASVAQLLRPGVTRFDLAVGELRNASVIHKPDVVQATLQRGFSNLLTGYAGAVASQGYAAALVGGAINTRYGAFALDVTQSHAQIPGHASESGQSTRLSYSKIMPEINTSLTVAAYRYSTSGYLSLNDASIARDYARRGLDAFQYVAPTLPTVDGVVDQSVLTPAQRAALAGSVYADPILRGSGLQRQRSSFSITMNQQLGQRGGSFYLNASANNYWNTSGTDTQFQIGYNNSFHHIGYGISATRTRDSLGQYDNQYMLNLSIPLGDTAHAPSLTANLSRDQHGDAQDQATLSGTLGNDNQLSYGATATHSSSAGGNAGSANLAYRSPYAVVNASYGAGSNYSQASLGVSGAIVAHAGGVTFGQPMGDTVGIVYVPGASGARVNNAAGARIDRAGYALVPYLSPFIMNTVQIDPKGLPLDVQLDATSAQVAPHAGAVVLLKFKTTNGRTLIVRGQLADGAPLPFGAEVFNEKDASLGVVGQAGKMLLRGVVQSGRLSVRWSDDNGLAQFCSFAYQMPAAGKRHATKAYDEITAICQRPQILTQAQGRKDR